MSLERTDAIPPYSCGGEVEVADDDAWANNILDVLWHEEPLSPSDSMPRHRVTTCTSPSDSPCVVSPCVVQIEALPPPPVAVATVCVDPLFALDGYARPISIACGHPDCNKQTVRNSWHSPRRPNRSSVAKMTIGVRKHYWSKHRILLALDGFPDHMQSNLRQCKGTNSMEAWDAVGSTLGDTI